MVPSLISCFAWFTRAELVVQVPDNRIWNRPPQPEDPPRCWDLRASLVGVVSGDWC